MAQLLTYHQIDRHHWQTLVQQSKTGTWFQRPEAYDFFASQSEVMEPFAYAVEKEGQLSAVCVGYVTKERSAIKQFFTRRAIIIGGPAVADTCTNEDLSGLLEAIHADIQSKTIYIETRNFNDYTSWREAFERTGFSYKPHLNFHVDPSVNKLSENRKRQLKRSNATVLDAAGEAEIREWYDVLAELYRTKVKTPLWPIEFFLEAYRQDIAKFLLVQHEERIIGGSMVVADEKTVYEWFECGLNAQYKDQYPSVMATFAGIQLAQQSCCTRYDMMGAGEPGVPYGVRDFKAEFGGKLVEHGRFLCVCKPMLYRIGATAVQLIRRIP